MKTIKFVIAALALTLLVSCGSSSGGGSGFQWKSFQYSTDVDVIRDKGGKGITFNTEQLNKNHPVALGYTESRNSMIQMGFESPHRTDSIQVPLEHHFYQGVRKSSTYVWSDYEPDTHSSRRTYATDLVFSENQDISLVYLKSDNDSLAAYGWLLLAGGVDFRPDSLPEGTFTYDYGGSLLNSRHMMVKNDRNSELREGMGIMSVTVSFQNESLGMTLNGSANFTNPNDPDNSLVYILSSPGLNLNRSTGLFSGNGTVSESETADSFNISINGSLHGQSGQDGVSGTYAHQDNNGSTANSRLFGGFTALYNP